MATKLLEAKKILEQYAPAGEFLAYINKEEAEILKSLGASGTPVEETGIPSFQVPSYFRRHRQALSTQMKATYSTPLQTGAFTPQVAAQDPMQQSAIGMAQAGVGSYAPYLAQAQTAMGQAGTAVGGLGALSGPGAGTGAGSIASFQSPYQQQVMDETLRQYDLSRGAGQQQHSRSSGSCFRKLWWWKRRRDARSVQWADTLANRAGIRAGLLQEGIRSGSNKQDNKHFGNQQADG